MRRALRLALGLLPLLAIGVARAQPAEGVITYPSAHGVRETLERFEAAVQAAGWLVFTEIDHAAAARQAGLALPARTVVLFGNPRGGTQAMQEHPTLALDLPMRALVWQDGTGKVHLSRSTGADIALRVFARHRVRLTAEQVAANEGFLDRLARRATD